MAKPNYAFIKRQKELAKKKEKAEKRQKKLHQSPEATQDDPPPVSEST